MVNLFQAETGSDVLEAKELSNYQNYGTLYNFSAALKACPSGWHLPTDEEWQVLELYLGMESYELNDDQRYRTTGNVGYKLKSDSGWKETVAPGGGNGDNSSGFNALPAGVHYNKRWDGIGSFTGFWSSTIRTENQTAWVRTLDFYRSGIRRASGSIWTGYYVRCIKD